MVPCHEVAAECCDTRFHGQDFILPPSVARVSERERERGTWDVAKDVVYLSFVVRRRPVGSKVATPGWLFSRSANKGSRTTHKSDMKYSCSSTP